MIELIFVIVVIGILAMIAIPKFSATRDDAIITKAKTTVASIRSSISSEAQRRLVAGVYTPIKNLGGKVNQYNKPIFDYFDSNSTGRRVLEYPPYSCKNSNAKGCWMRTGSTLYKYIFPSSIGGDVTFGVQNNRFDCTSSDKSKCRLLER
jgi:general secretion pathway protein G